MNLYGMPGVFTFAFECRNNVTVHTADWLFSERTCSHLATWLLCRVCRNVVLLLSACIRTKVKGQILQLFRFQGATL